MAIAIVNQKLYAMSEDRFDKVYTSFTDFDPPLLTPAEEILLMQPTTENNAWAVVGDLVYLTPETLAILDITAAEWAELFPDGEPRFKRPGYIFVLHSIDLADALEMSLRSAQRVLQLTRIKLQKEKTAEVTVKEFCVVNKYDEEDLRRKLRDLYK